MSNSSNPVPISRIVRENNVSGGYTNNIQQKSYIDQQHGKFSSRSGGDNLDSSQVKLSNDPPLKPGRAIEHLTMQNILQIQRSLSKQSINNNKNGILSS